MGRDPLPSSRNVAIVAGLQLRWDGVWQRPHHILSRLAKRVPVIVVEEPFLLEDEPPRDELRRDGNVTVIRPLRPQHGTPMADAQTIATVRELLGPREPLVWLYQPLMLGMADALGGSLVYDCMDDLAAFALAPPQMRAFERATIERASRVFCGGLTLYETHRSAGDKVRLFPSGVEFAYFHAASTAQPHAVVEALPRPRWGYVGVIDERLDYALLELLAAADGAPNVVMIGPIAKIDPAILPRLPNVHFTGKLPYAQLPSILAGLDVALMPFARNESTRSISPTKTLEYLAAGVPVVTTPVADVVAQYGDVVCVAEGDAFVEACCTVQPDPHGVEVARRYEWNGIVDGIWSEISELL